MPKAEIYNVLFSRGVACVNAKYAIDVIKNTTKEDVWPYDGSKVG